jgi:hypothetical protein
MAFSATQASEFAEHWRVVHHQSNTESGFSATLFERIDDDPLGGFQAGELVYAIRGTEAGTIGDISADVGDIMLDGLAINQIVDLYNDWMRILAGDGQVYEAAQLEYNADLTIERQSLMGEELDQFDALLASQGYVIDQPVGNVYAVTFAPSDEVFGADDERAHGDVNIDSEMLAGVTGHSLGGHLADAFTRLFPGTAEALTVNGAGYATGALPGFGLTADTNIDTLFAELGGASEFTASDIQNVYGETMPEFVTMDQVLGLQQQGSSDAVFIEQQNPLTYTLGHGASQITDSLAVYDLFIRLDSTLASQDLSDTLAQLKPIFEQSSNLAADSLETVVVALTQIITGTKPYIEIDDRDQLYAAINTLSDNSVYKNLLGKVQISATARMKT